ncbi:hypothetical protein OQA88_12330 [Cercophora sp. LCS_1]
MSQQTQTTLHPRALHSTPTPKILGLPPTIQTPAGLALLELQGTFNLPANSGSDPGSVSIGHLIFPDYDPDGDPNDTKWMKKVFLFVGEYQRLQGEVKKLGMPVGVVRRRGGDRNGGGPGDGNGEELEVVEIVRWKIVFGGRPEPVGGR